MSDDSDDKSNGHSNGEPKGTILGDNAGVYIPSEDADEAPQASAPADFGSFIVSLGTNCMINLGRVPHPETGELTHDLASAKHTIDILSMLEHRTQGNLSAAEEKLLQTLLHDVRTAYAEERDKAKN